MRHLGFRPVPAHARGRLRAPTTRAGAARRLALALADALAPDEPERRRALGRPRLMFAGPRPPLRVQRRVASGDVPTGREDVPARLASIPVASPDDLRRPRPLRAAALLLLPVPLLAAAWAVGALPMASALVAGLVAVVLSVFRGAVGAFDLHRCRALGEALLRAHAGQPVSALAAWRSAELTSERSRRELAGFVRVLRRETEACLHPPDPSVDRAVLDTSSVLMRRLEDRLERLSDPVSPLGMIDVRSIATDRLSPLYFPERAPDLPAALLQALTALEPV